MTSKSSEIRRILIWFACGVLLGCAVSGYWFVHEGNAGMREISQISVSTLASSHLATLKVLRDDEAESDEELVDAAIAQLENALVGDLDLLSRIKQPNPATALVLRQIQEYQKAYPISAEESSADGNSGN